MRRVKRQRLQMQRPAPTTAAIEKLLEDVPPDFGVPRINQYTCRECGGVITTTDKGDGVTPMFLLCRATVGCEGRMQSSMYLCDQTLEPTHEWFRPTGKVAAHLREHVKMGGLLIRKIGGET